jgi:hypothetical protein
MYVANAYGHGAAVSAVHWGFTLASYLMQHVPNLDVSQVLRFQSSSTPTMIRITTEPTLQPHLHLVKPMVITLLLKRGSMCTCVGDICFTRLAGIFTRLCDSELGSAKCN